FYFLVANAYANPFAHVFAPEFFLDVADKTAAQSVNPFNVQCGGARDELNDFRGDFHCPQRRLVKRRPILVFHRFHLLWPPLTSSIGPRIVSSRPPSQNVRAPTLVNGRGWSSQFLRRQIPRGLASFSQSPHLYCYPTQ